MIQVSKTLKHLLPQFIIICLLLLQPALVRGASLFEDCDLWLSGHGIVNNIAASPYDTPIELEMVSSEKVMALLTTLDGTLAPLLLDRNPPEWLPVAFPGQNLKAVLWDSLSVDEKEQLLAFNATYAKPFYEERRVNGIRVRDRIEIETPKKNYRIFGKTYEQAGKYWLDLNPIFGKTVVEYKSRFDILGFNGVELHFRPDQTTFGMSAGQVSVEAGRFQNLIGERVTHQHAHILAKAPIKTFSRSIEKAGGKWAGVTQIVDWFRRINQVLEMNRIVNVGGGISKVAIGDEVFFDNMSKYDEVWYYINDYLSVGKVNATGDLRQGYVGFRGLGTYSDPTLWGVEVRGISTQMDNETRRNLLDLIQDAMMREDWNSTIEEIQDWVKYLNSSLNGEGKTFYAMNWDGALTASLKLQKQLVGAIDGPWYILGKRDWFEAFATGKHEELKMLTHDWSYDFLVYKNPQFQAKIVAEQRRAFSRLNKLNPQAYDIDKKIVELMRDFLVDSGLFDRWRNSLLRQTRFDAR